MASRAVSGLGPGRPAIGSRRRGLPLVDRGSVLPGHATWAGPGHLPSQAAVWGREGLRQRRRGVSGLRSRSAALERRGPQSSCTCVPRLPPHPGSVSGGPHRLSQAGILDSPGCVLLGRGSPGMTPSSRDSEQLQGGGKCRTPPRLARSGRGSRGLSSARDREPQKGEASRKTCGSSSFPVWDFCNCFLIRHSEVRSRVF